MNGFKYCGSLSINDVLIEGTNFHASRWPNVPKEMIEEAAKAAGIPDDILVKSAVEDPVKFGDWSIWIRNSCSPVSANNFWQILKENWLEYEKGLEHEKGKSESKPEYKLVNRFIEL